ncbi:MAG: hypothetical protein AB2693_08505 [Candidatus Thiodiazotropha sp.]
MKEMVLGTVLGALTLCASVHKKKKTKLQIAKAYRLKCINYYHAVRHFYGVGHFESPSHFGHEIILWPYFSVISMGLLLQISGKSDLYEFKENIEEI